jgi:hypothetical protein
MNREQGAVVEYLKEENRVLRELLGKSRPWLDYEQRRHLAVRAKAVGRVPLSTLHSIVTPDTVLRYHRKPIAMTYDYIRGPGRRERRPPSATRTAPIDLLRV